MEFEIIIRVGNFARKIFINMKSSTGKRLAWIYVVKLVVHEYSTIKKGIEIVKD